MKNITNSRLTRLSRNSAMALAVFVFFIGALAVVGWSFSIDTFKRILPTLPIIAPNTSILLVLVSLVLFFMYSEKEAKSFLGYVAAFFSSLIFLCGAVTLAEYIFGLNMGIDNIFFAGKMDGAVVRMSPQSAFNFVAVGLALFMFAGFPRKGIRAGQTIIVIAGMVSLISLLGFLYNIPGLYTLPPYKGMAAHTAVAFVLVFSSILLLRPEEGFMRIFVAKGLSAVAARRLLGALGAVFIVELLVMLGRRAGLYGEAYESLIHLVFVAGVFFFLIFFAFRSLDQLAYAEQNLAEMKEIDKAKTEFVSLASHQLRTPLTSISWFTEMLLGHEVGELNAKQRDYLREVYTQNRRMIGLVDDLLNSSRIDMGTLAIEPKPTDLADVCESVIKELDPLIRERKMNVEKKYEQGMPSVEVDPELVRIVFQNLLSNAVKYTPAEGKVSVAISCSGRSVAIEIADNGYGIPKKQQSKIFTKMFRADNIRDKETDGTGLGLYIVKAIVKESGGKIEFESEENVGTTFSVYLPLKAKKKSRRQQT